MSTNEDVPCDHADLVRDYAFDELAPTERRHMEQHLTACPACAAELDQWRLTTAALRVLPELEMPRRIAFVSDRGGTGWIGGFWNSAARLGFASACVLAVGLCFAGYRVTELRAPQAAGVSEAAIQAAVNSDVNRAVAVAVNKAHADDMRLTKAALDAVDGKYAEKQRDLMVLMSETLDHARKSMELNTVYAMTSDSGTAGAGQ